MKIKPLNEDWSDLEHAYGSAQDVPELLETFKQSPNRRTWDNLWSCLCHQGTFYSATWWALPHIVEVVKNTTSKDEQEFYLFLTTIEITRQICKVSLTEDEQALRDYAFEQAVQLTPAYLSRHLENADVLQSVLAFYAVLGQNAHLAEMLIMLPKSLENVLDEKIEM